MKVVMCCPKCGNEDLTLKKEYNPYVYICDKCKFEFDSMWSGFQTYKTELFRLEDWFEEDGACLWWKFPIEEEPYVGSPLDVNFPNDVTHFTRIVIPQELSK